LLHSISHGISRILLICALVRPQLVAEGLRQGPRHLLDRQAFLTETQSGEPARYLTLTRDVLDALPEGRVCLLRFGKDLLEIRFVAPEADTYLIEAWS